MERGMQERIIEEEAAAFCPALGLPAHHQLTATWSFQTWGQSREKKMKAGRARDAGSREWQALEGALDLQSPDPAPHPSGAPLGGWVEAVR